MKKNHKILASMVVRCVLVLLLTCYLANGTGLDKDSNLATC